MCNFFYANIKFFLLSILVTSVILKILILNSNRFNSYIFNSKKLEKNIPLIGGIAIFSVCMIFFIFLFNFSILIEHYYLFFSILLIFLLGLYDDVKGLNAYKKMIFQFLAFLLLLKGLHFNQFILFNSFGYIANLFLLICFIFGICNSINLIDGIDGLSASISIIISLSFLLFNILFLGDLSKINLFLFILIGSLVSFLYYNKYPAKIFLGDSGSLLIGWFFTILSLTIIKDLDQALSVIIPLIIIGVPAFDVLFVMIDRYFKSLKISLFEKFLSMFISDDRHIHHLFIKNKFSKTATIIILCFFNIIICLSLFTYYHFWKLNNILLLLSFLIIIYYFIRKILENNFKKNKYDE